MIVLAELEEPAEIDACAVFAADDIRGLGRRSLHPASWSVILRWTCQLVNQKFLLPTPGLIQ
jgi:hypothetical protein